MNPDTNAQPNIILPSTNDITPVGSAPNGNRSSSSASEWRTLLLVGLPIALLAALLIADRFSAVASKDQIRAIVAQLKNDGIPVDRQAIIQSYEAQTSKDETLQWAALLESTWPFQDDPNHGMDGAREFAMISPTAKSDPIVNEHELNLDVLDFITNRDRPLTAARQKLLEPKTPDSDQPVWLPLGSGLGTRWQPSWSNSLVGQDIREFQADIAHARNEDAIKVLQRLRKTVSQLEPIARYQSVSQDTPQDVYSLIRASLAVADWDADQLTQLRDMVQSKPDYAKLHKQMMEHTIATSLDLLGVETDAPFKARVGRNQSQSIVVPPQTVLQWLRYMQKGKSDAQPGTLAMLTDYQWAWGHYPRWAETEAVSLTTFPLATGTKFMNTAGAETGWLISGYARYETDRRWTLTALAIKQYKLEHGQWPAELSDLSQVGLNRSDWEIMPNVPFGYQAKPLVDDSSDEVVLWTSRASYGNMRDQLIAYTNSSEYREPPREHSLSLVYEMSQIALIRETGK